MKKTKKKIILAIETSCDDTGIALIKCGGTLKSPRFKVLKNIISSQIKIHQPFGGVVPNLAKREHIRNLPILYRKISKLKVKSLKFKVDCIAVTVGPGLEPALWTGINFAQELAEKIKKPLIGVNHMEGHLYSALLSPSASAPKIEFPAIALIVSGGHTILLYMESLTKWVKLGETLDDAAGEAFDKVARILELPYPGGPEIEKLAKQGNPKAIAFPRPMLNQKNYNFSFSGLKTSVLYYLRDKNILGHPMSQILNPRNFRTSDVYKLKADIAASFQQAAIDVLTKKAMRASEEFSAKSIILCGGVACNKALRETIKSESEKRELNFIAPELKFNTDNAAMIAVAAYIHSLAKKEALKIEANGNLTI